MSQRESVRIWSSSFLSSGFTGYSYLELLLHEAPVDLDVARLVHHLGGAVHELGLEPRHAVDDLRGGQQRALLTVEELAELPRVHMVVHATARRRIELLRVAFPDHGVEDASVSCDRE